MILEKLFSKSATVTRPGPTDDYWYQPVAGPSASGVVVTVDKAMRVAAVYACVRVLAESLAQLPLIVYERREDGGKDRAKDHPLYKILHDQPNQFQTAFEFREMLMGHLVLRGNAYALILPGVNGSVTELIPLSPTRMKVEALPNRRLRYTYQALDGKQEIFNQDDIFHLRGLSSDGITGLSPIELARDPIGLSKAAEEHGSKVFGNRATPAGILTHPRQLSQKGRERLAQDFASNYSGANAHRTLLLEEGMDWKQIGMTDRDSQWIESRKFQISEIARIFRVPPHLIGDLDRATFSNIEHQSLEFVVHTMGPWFVRWEQAILRQLVADPDTYFAEFLVDGLMRGDSQSRAAFYASALQGRWLSRNEVRIRENLNPIPGGDDYENPAITVTSPRPAPDPADAEDSADDSADESTTDARAAISPLLADAAERIAAREVNGLSRRADKADQDRERFDAWLVEFYEGHSAAVVKMMGPICHAWAALSGAEIDPARIAGAIAGNAKQKLTTNPAAVVVAWEVSRASEVGGIINSILFEGA